MGAGASASPREKESDLTPRIAGDLALFSAIQREYDQMATEELGNEVIFERMKQICKTAYAPRDPNAPKSAPANGRGLYRRSSDPQRKKREVVYSKGLVRSAIYHRSQLQ